jgi:deferrochelatase/peroxidase EfeB
VSPPPLDKAQIQGLIVYGNELDRSRHFVLQVQEPAAARGFVAWLMKRGLITDASLGKDAVLKLKGDQGCAMSIGFTYRGFASLQLPAPYLRVFQEKAKAFAEGACLRASRRLADTGLSAPGTWDPCFKQDFAHVLLSLHADEENDLERLSEELQKSGDAGFRGWDVPLEGCHLDKKPAQGNPAGRKAHFGFPDGISNPIIEGFHNPKPLRKSHAPGEFLLGYGNDESFNPWLLIDPLQRPSPWLLPRAPIKPEFFRNGSFAAFRKIQQHEKPFRAFVDTWATKLGVTPEYVRAKLCGRWDDGTVVKPEQKAAPGYGAGIRTADMDEFDFARDPRGEGCPFGSHIRRMNPRADRIVPFRRRPLARRGMPYGPIYDRDEHGEPERGLLGLFFCASLEDQFEHLVSEWGDSNPMGPANRGTAKDPLMGGHENTRALFDVPMPDEALRQVGQFTPFVRTRGTLYAFFPGLKALRMIANQHKSAG